VEAVALRKVLLYLLTAIAVGLLMTLVPLFVFVEIKSQNRAMTNAPFSEEWKGGHEGSYSLGVVEPSSSDLEILTVCFLVAMTVYLLVKRKVPGRGRGWFRMVPY
jgi:hypothetical protein